MDKIIDKLENGKCYESNSLQEVCELNEKGEFVCNRLKQTWKHCPGNEKVLVASIKEEGIREELPNISFPNVESLFSQFPMNHMNSSNIFNDFFNFTLNPTGNDNNNLRDDDYIDPRSYKNPKVRREDDNNFPEPQHWKR